MKKLVRKTLTGSSLSESRVRNLSAMAARPDAEIDISDIPPLTEKFWANTVRNPYCRPVQQQLTVRLDSDVVAWLRENGKGYQTRMNQVLREAMIGDINKG